MALQNHEAVVEFSPVRSQTGARGLPHPLGSGMPPAPDVDRTRRKGDMVENKGRKGLGGSFRAAALQSY